MSRESAPSSANLVSGVRTVSSDSANCFFTISHTLFNVSGFAYHINYSTSSS